MIKKLIKKPGTPTKKPVIQHGKKHVTPRSEHNISRADISKNALKVLRSLSRAGYSAYMVGGGVRDLLLHHAPKDFDIATNATPEDIRRLFRNCRLIGRRFRLAHVYFRREVIEVATFRAAEGQHPEEHRHSKEGMIVRDNVYGTLEEDAWRRDFTVNALYYDITDFSVVDFTGGIKDIENKVLRIIGDPEQRYREDPVRILRAIRFAAKLDFTLEAKTESAIKKLADNLSLISPSRLFEETVKLFHGGHAVKAYHLLKNYGLLDNLFQQTQLAIQQWSETSVEELLLATLTNTDKRIENNMKVTPAFLFASFLWHSMQLQAKQFEEEGYTPLAAVEQAMGKVLNQQRHQTAIPRRLSSIIREIWILQYRLPRRYGKRPFTVLQHPRFRAAYDFLLLRAASNEASQELADWWTDFQVSDEETQTSMINEQQKQLNKRRSRRQRKQS